MTGVLIGLPVPGAVARLRTWDVDHERTLADQRENNFLRFVERVDVTVNQSGRDVEEPAGIDRYRLLASRPEFEPGLSLQHVAEHVALAVVMPA